MLRRNRKANQRQSDNTPKLRGRNGDIELQPIERGSVVPTGKTHTREVETREERKPRERSANTSQRDDVRPGIRQRETTMRDRLYNILDEIGPYDVLELIGEYCECERDDIPKSNQPYRVYWRKAQLLLEECAERFWKIKISSNKE